MNPTRQFPSKNWNFEFFVKMSLPNSHKHLNVLSTISFNWLPWRRRHFCSWFSSLLSSIFRKKFSNSNFETKVRWFELLSAELNGYWLIKGGALSKTESVLRVKLLFMVTVWRVSSCLAERFLWEHATFHIRNSEIDDFN